MIEKARAQTDSSRAGAETARVGATGPAEGRDRDVRLRILGPGDEGDCRFWVGLAAPGDQDPEKLMDFESVPEVFSEAATRGVREEEPLMLTDTDRQPPRFFYLLPVPGENFRERTAWSQELVTTLSSWCPDHIGFYLAPELMPAATATQLLTAILKQMIESRGVGDFYLLVGRHGRNQIVNVALNLKTELETNSMAVHVFH